MNAILNISALGYHLLLPLLRGNETLVELAQIEASCLITLRAANELETFEMKVLDAIDKHVIRKSRLSLAETLTLGTCIRRMALHYRRIAKWGFFVQGMFVCAARPEEAQLTSPKPGKAERVKNAETMYDAMTRHYARVFRGKLSPFCSEWNDVDHREVFDGDEELGQMFQNIKFAEKYHCKSINTRIVQWFINAQTITSQSAMWFSRNCSLKRRDKTGRRQWITLRS